MCRLLTLAVAATLVGCSAGGSQTPSQTPSASPSQTPSGSAVTKVGPGFQLRPVLELHAAGPDECSASPGVLDPATAVIACGETVGRQTVYSLAPAAVTGAMVASATVADGAVGAELHVTLTEEGAAALAAITGELADQMPPRNSLAIVIEGVVQSAPEVQESILGGAVVVSGFASRQEAEAALASLSRG